MRSLSSIIKGERIRTQSIIDFSTRQIDVLAEEDYINETTDQSSFDEKEQLESIQEKQLKEIQELIDAKLEEADNQVRQMLSEAIQKSQAIEEEAKQLKTHMLFEMTKEKEEVLEEARKQAEHILANAHKEKEELIMSTEGELVETLITLLNHIISEEMNYQVDWVKYLVRKMLSKEEILGKVKVIISPILYARLSEKEFDAIKGIRKDLEIETRDNLNETTCMIEFNQGSIVYDISQGLERVINDTRILMNAK